MWEGQNRRKAAWNISRAQWGEGEMMTAAAAEPLAVIRLCQGAVASTLDQGRLRSARGAFLHSCCHATTQLLVFLDV